MARSRSTWIALLVVLNTAACFGEPPPVRRVGDDESGSDDTMPRDSDGSVSASSSQPLMDTSSEGGSDDHGPASDPGGSTTTDDPATDTGDEGPLTTAADEGATDDDSTGGTTTDPTTGGDPVWTCFAEFYDADDGCDCGCGIVDPDCADSTAASCDYCTNDGSCGTIEACPGDIDPSNNAVCID